LNGLLPERRRHNPPPRPPQQLSGQDNRTPTSAVVEDEYSSRASARRGRRPRSTGCGRGRTGSETGRERP
jgi:hypothetical protein